MYNFEQAYKVYLLMIHKLWPLPINYRRRNQLQFQKFGNLLLVACAIYLGISQSAFGQSGPESTIVEEVSTLTSLQTIYCKKKNQKAVFIKDASVCADNLNDQDSVINQLKEQKKALQESDDDDNLGQIQQLEQTLENLIEIYNNTIDAINKHTAGFSPPTDGSPNHFTEANADCSKKNTSDNNMLYQIQYIKFRHEGLRYNPIQYNDIIGEDIVKQLTTWTPEQSGTIYGANKPARTNPVRCEDFFVNTLVCCETTNNTPPPY